MEKACPGIIKHCLSNWLLLNKLCYGFFSGFRFFHPPALQKTKLDVPNALLKATKVTPQEPHTPQEPKARKQKEAQEVKWDTGLFHTSSYKSWLQIVWTIMKSSPCKSEICKLPRIAFINRNTFKKACKKTKQARKIWKKPVLENSVHHLFWNLN